MNFHEMESRIVRLEALVEKLELERETPGGNSSGSAKGFRQSDRTLFSLAIVGGGFILFFMILFLIWHALWLRHDLEVRRMNFRPQAFSSATGTASPDSAPRKSAAENAPEQASSTPNAQQKLERYIDSAAEKSKSGNSYSLTLDGLGEVVNSMVKTGEIAADKATDLMKELGTKAIGTTGNILEETAKAIIARHLGPKEKAKEAEAAPTQQVLVNVYNTGKPAVTVAPRKPVTSPPKKLECPVSVSASKDLSCPTPEKS